MQCKKHVSSVITTGTAVHAMTRALERAPMSHRQSTRVGPTTVDQQSLSLIVSQTVMRPLLHRDQHGMGPAKRGPRGEELVLELQSGLAQRANGMPSSPGGLKLCGGDLLKEARQRATCGA